MLYCYQITATGKISCLNMCKVNTEKSQNECKLLIMKTLKNYFFKKVELYDKNFLCSIMTDKVDLKIEYNKKTYELKYMIFISTEKFFECFQKMFNPDDFNLNFLIQDWEMLHNIGIEKISVNNISMFSQLLGCEEADLKENTMQNYNF